MKKKFILGIDTSNYTTSAALSDCSGNAVSKRAELLKVRQGEKGLRQSDALFEHIKIISEVIDSVVGDAGKDIIAVSCSSRPRPVEGSYMPVFRAGEAVGKSIASVLRVPYFEFSHQEGHIEAVKNFSSARDTKKILSWHLSGGTCELLSAFEKDDGGYDVEILSSTSDISFGQLLDRTGVRMGFMFPSGKALDEIALKGAEPLSVLKPVYIKGEHLNLSGMESQCMRLLDRGEVDKDRLVSEIFMRISECLIRITETAAEKTGIKDVIFAGGVSSSRYIRNALSRHFENKEVNVIFGKDIYSTDNAVGTAILGGKALCRQNR